MLDGKVLPGVQPKVESPAGMASHA
jgi:hypothetical protein